MPHSELVSKTLNLRLSPSMIKVELKAKMVKELQPLTVILRAAARPEFSLMRVPLAVTLKMGLLKADIIEICPISYVSSCFGAGYWIEDYGWSESDAWSE